MTLSTYTPIECGNQTRCKCFDIQGRVQGVGFRPFVFRLAHQLELDGEIYNTPQGVRIEVEGNAEKIHVFVNQLQTQLPPIASIDCLKQMDCEPNGWKNFSITSSKHDGKKSSLILPDLAVCPECIHEIFDPTNRRYFYPFTNCTNCGPRFSIVNDLPYDRCNTSMNTFIMCSKCQEEYENPNDRRFHAQPNACPVCGPHIELWDAKGKIISSHHEAIVEISTLIKEGKIVAVKGLGGFHLMVDARNNPAIKLLRQRKQRDEKPFAVMVPNMGWVEQLCHVGEIERSLLQSYKSPIVLLKRKNHPPVNLANSVVGQNPYLGVMLAYTPLHHILMKHIGFPVVTTSGNLSDEPICTDEDEAVKRLKGIADYFLVHNRKIVRHVDDPVVRNFKGEEQVIRRARGYAPLPIKWNTKLPSVVAVGGHLKNTVAITERNHIFLSQHIGDLETLESMRAFEEVQSTFQQTYQCHPNIAIHDLHPDYMSTKYAQSHYSTCMPVQHHHAHILSCMAEHHLEGTVLGVAWDGTGYGTDGTIWGGEFLTVNGDQFSRFASLQTFPLPGGESAIKNTKLIALGLLYALYEDDAFEQKYISSAQEFSDEELNIYKSMLRTEMNCPHTSSMGRLFDAVASIIGMRQTVSYEGQAAIELEWNINEDIDTCYQFELFKEKNGGNETVPKYRIGLHSLINDILSDVSKNCTKQTISTKFHNTLVEIILTLAKKQNKKRVVLSGGCFQNQYLLERSIHRLQEEGFEVYWHKQIPANDGGISLGQIAYAAHHLCER